MPEPDSDAATDHAQWSAPARDQTGRRRDTRDPRRSRERALKVLFQADVRGEAPIEALRRVVREPAARALLDDADGGSTDLAHGGGSTDPINGGGSTDPGHGGQSTDPSGAASSELDGFARRLVEGVNDHLGDLDARIGRFARRWRVERMPVVDRNVLRLATYEMLHEDTGHAVVINEAVELVKSLSTEDSGRFVNGVLEAIRRSLVDDGAASNGSGEDGTARPG